LSQARRASYFCCLAVLAGYLTGCSGTGQEGHDQDGGVTDAGPDASPEAGLDAALCSEEGADGASQPGCGTLQVDGLFNVCAKVGGYLLSPLSTVVDGGVSLSAFAEDKENDPVTYIWSASFGSLSQPTAPATEYRCEVVGEQIVTLTVSDSPGCISKVEIPVTCLEAPAP
jgi:hypothetical protein